MEIRVTAPEALPEMELSQTRHLLPWGMEKRTEFERGSYTELTASEWTKGQGRAMETDRGDRHPDGVGGLGRGRSGGFEEDVIRRRQARG